MIHDHTIDNVSAYDVVRSTWVGRELRLETIKSFSGPRSYGAALEAAKAERDLNRHTYAYPASRWPCGCSAPD